MSYLRGASACLLVIDSTRKTTQDTAMRLYDEARHALGSVPIILVLNKVDLSDQWEVDDAALASLPVVVVRTSAKTGVGVEAAFEALARTMLSA